MGPSQLGLKKGPLQLVQEAVARRTSFATTTLIRKVLYFAFHDFNLECARVCVCVPCARAYECVCVRACVCLFLVFCFCFCFAPAFFHTRTLSVVPWVQSQASVWPISTKKSWLLPTCTDNIRPKMHIGSTRTGITYVYNIQLNFLSLP